MWSQRAQPGRCMDIGSFPFFLLFDLCSFCTVCIVNGNLIAHTSSRLHITYIICPSPSLAFPRLSYSWLKSTTALPEISPRRSFCTASLNLLSGYTVYTGLSKPLLAKSSVL